MDIFVSYRGASRASVTCDYADADSVWWMSEGALSNLAVYRPDDFIPSDPNRANKLAAAIATIAGDVGEIPEAAVYVMWDFEEWPPEWKYTTDNGVSWAGGYQSGLSEPDHDAAGEYSWTGVYTEAAAQAPGKRFGAHDITHTFSHSYARTAGHSTEAGTNFAGAYADMDWYGALLQQINGVMFARLYVNFNIGDNDGAVTEAHIYNFAYNNALGFLEAATYWGLSVDDIIVYTWHFKVGASERPTLETMRQFKAGLEAAGITKWCVAMGAANNASDASSATAYLATLASLFDSGGDEDGGGQNAYVPPDPFQRPRRLPSVPSKRLVPVTPAI